MRWVTGEGHKILGKWGIIVHGTTLRWFYPDGGDAAGYPARSGLDIEYRGYIDTWSRDFHVYAVNRGVAPGAFNVGCDGFYTG